MKRAASPQRAADAPRGSAVDADRGAIFLRADRIDGAANELIEASGKVELRARRETVLADWLRYDFWKTRFRARAMCSFASRHRHDLGPEMKFKRDTETGYFKSPRFTWGRTAPMAMQPRSGFSGPDHFEATSASYTTCVAPHRDWYLHRRQIEVDRLRLVGTAHRARIFFLDVPVLRAVARVSADQRAQVRIPHTHRRSRHRSRGFELATPYYFNLAPNYDATFTPRLMTKRGLMLEGQGRYLFEPAGGEIIAEVLPYDRVADTSRWAFSWKHNQQFQPWLNGFLNYNRVSDATYFADFSDRVAVTSAKTLPQEAGLICELRTVTLRCWCNRSRRCRTPTLPVTPPYNMLPQLKVTMNETDWGGLRGAGTRSTRNFAQSSLVPTGDRAVLYPSVAGYGRGPRGSSTRMPP